MAAVPIMLADLRIAVNVMCHFTNEYGAEGIALDAAGSTHRMRLRI
jgi:hypothetical protein